MDLPVEVLQMIFRDLDREDLFHCTQVCQSWRLAATDPHLWKKYPYRQHIDLFHYFHTKVVLFRPEEPFIDLVLNLPNLSHLDVFTDQELGFIRDPRLNRLDELKYQVKDSRKICLMKGEEEKIQALTRTPDFISCIAETPDFTQEMRLEDNPNLLRYHLSNPVTISTFSPSLIQLSIHADMTIDCATFQKCHQLKDLTVIQSSNHDQRSFYQLVNYQLIPKSVEKMHFNGFAVLYQTEKDIRDWIATFPDLISIFGILRFPELTLVTHSRLGLKLAGIHWYKGELKRHPMAPYRIHGVNI